MKVEESNFPRSFKTRSGAGIRRISHNLADKLSAGYLRGPAGVYLGPLPGYELNVKLREVP